MEYTKALEHLDRFVDDASLRELEFADEIVRDNDHFIIYTNLSRRLEQQPNILSERGKNERDDFARHGLPWVLGLARIELGAMLAGFTSAAEPFQLVVPPKKSPRSPERYGAEEYFELLLDGMRTHYWSLKNDPEVWNYRKSGVPVEHLVTYTRRLTVARQFLVAAETTAPGVLNPAQTRLLGEWGQELAAVHRMLIYCLAKKQGQERFAVEQLKAGGGWKSRPEVSRQLNTSPLPDVLELIDPTLKFCQCR